MKPSIYSLLVTLLLVSCSDTSDKNFIVKGEVIGLKKGTIYLEKIVNNEVIAIDSIYLDDGTEQFVFANNIKEPELFIISLDKSNNKYLSFFGEPGEVSVKTNLDDFFIKSKITGSSQQTLLEKHDEYIKKFSDQDLDLVKERFEAIKESNKERVAKIEEKRLQNLKRRYLFSANFATVNNDKAIAPFIACTKMDKAAPKLKQKIYDALDNDIKASKYGILLKESLESNE